MNTVITKEHFEKGQDFESYLSMVEGLVIEGKTTGTNQTKYLIELTALNLQRMLRIWKNTKIVDELEACFVKNKRKQIWFVLAEAWCGDAAQNLPVLAKMASLSDQIELRILLRDEYPAVMNAYLSNGTRSIPKLIMIDANTWEEIGTWGARPEAIKSLVPQFKKNADGDHLAFVVAIQKWYAKDKGVSIQQDFCRLLRT